MLRVRAVVVGGFAVSLVACASVLGIDDPIIDQDASVGDMDAAIDATGGGDAHVDGAPLADGGDAGDVVVIDSAMPDGAIPDGAMLDSGLDARDGDAGCPTTVADSTQVFVDSNATSDAGTCGAMTMPCKTIQAGLDRAQSLGKTMVYVAHGSYVEVITLHAGIKVQGGWEVSGTTWSPTCNAPVAAVVITAPTTSNTTVIATNVAGASLDTLTIKSKATAAAGESIYGVFATGAATTLVLNDVDVQVASAGDGASAAGGVDGGNAVGDCLPAGAGGTPAAGSPGSPADAGSFTTNGYVPVTGGSGSAGLRGDNGPAGMMASCVNCVTCTQGLGCTTNANGMQCGTAGQSGCGGGPGGGGGGGGGGGSSVALYAFDAMVNVTSSTLAAGNGGSGAPGGSGGHGGGGSVGSMGTSGNTCPTHCTAGLGSCTPDTIKSGDGGLGSEGGAGSAGGAGGGGAGGWSCGYVKAGAATVTIDSATLLAITNGNPGTGAGGAASGKGQSKCP